MMRVARVLGIAGLLVFMFHLAPAQTDVVSLKREAAKNMSAGRFGEAITLLDRYLQGRPGDADAYRLRARCYQSRNRPEKAVDDLRRAVSLEPSNADTKTELDRLIAGLRASVESRIDGYKRELARNPAAVDPYLQIARAYRTINDLPSAEQWYDEYFRRADASPVEVLRYCELLAAANHLQKGETLLQQHVQKHPQSAELQSRLGYFLLWQARYGAAQRAFQKALSLSPGLDDARQGLVALRTKEAAASRAEQTAVDTRITPGADTPVDRLLRMLQKDRRDEEARFALVQAFVKVDRFEEGLQQLDTLAILMADSIRIDETRSALKSARERVYRARIAADLEVLAEKPEDRPTLLRIARAHGDIEEYPEARSFLDRYLAGQPDSAAREVRFQYAQYAAWGKDFDAAQTTLDGLLRMDPGDTEYQLLYGQVSVWAARDLDQGIRYLNNVLRRSPGNIQARLTMSSALALKKRFPEARQHLDRVRSVDPMNRQLAAAQAFYDESVRAEAERADFALLESARELTAEGDCQGAIRKYEEYLARVSTPGTFALMEYADAQSCAKNHAKAIQIYDELLDQEYDRDVAVLRAKNILWSGDSAGAFTAFTRLHNEDPDDVTVSLFLGQSLQALGRTEEAGKVYQALLDKPVTGEDREQVLAQMAYLPRTGFSGALASFPTRIAMSPQIAHYSDNQEFSIATVGGQVEVGVARPVAVGFQYARSFVRSGLSDRIFNSAKGQLFVHLSDRLSATASAGGLSTPGKKKRLVGDVALVYNNPGVVRIAGYAEASDAAVLLYTPYLIDLHYEARVYRISGMYISPSRWRVQGYYKIFNVSDGNQGLELQVRLGRTFVDELSGGYEYMYTDWREQPPYVPFTQHNRQLYYAPQSLEAHYLWAEWTPQTDRSVTATFSAKVGYLPAFRSSVREFVADVQHHLTPVIGVAGVLSVGNTYRYDGSYSYVSVGASLYWTVL
jgi:tetratricopeptide (TPR) repeat protein